MRYLVVHAHLYQPPRENPWTEVNERQPSALPFHDWNERVSDECYERLGAAGVHGPDTRIVALLNLFARMSFNIGPTLAAWLEQERPEVMRDAAAGDRAAAERTGCGSALMQAYGHPILPLCEPRERRLQIAWGRADFELRFGRHPEGVWLPECAVDTATLEACADAGLCFTVVAPEQVSRIRPLGASAWEDVSGSRVPPHRPYLVKLPSGRDFTIFVFDGPLSRGAAFGGRLRNGDALLSSFRDALNGIPDPDGLVLLAADGETFGHHQKHAEEALAEALVRARLTGLAQVTNLADVRRRFPPAHELRLVEPSSWSCAHGVGRWERDCGCGAGARDRGWNWAWRQVLRHAVTILRDRVFSLVDRRGGEMFLDPWDAAEAYGEVVVNPPSPQRVQALLDRHAAAGLDDAGRMRAASLLELIRQTLFAATSCGWFFDDIAGLEAVQVLRHAARAAELTRSVFDIDPEPDLVHELANATANLPGAGSGADVYRNHVLTARRRPCEAAASHAATLMREALRTAEPPSTMSTSFGAYSCEDAAPPRIELNASGRVEVEGDVQVRHRRTGSLKQCHYSLVSEAPGAAMRIEIDGQSGGTPSPTVREQLLTLTASRAAGLLPAPSEEILLRLAWMGREARDLGAPLPSPFPEALRGGGRALVQELLTRPPRSPRQGLRALGDALSAARAAGLTREDLADLRPELDRRLTYYAGWALTTGGAEAVAELAATIETSRLAAGDAVLSRLRRWLVDRFSGAPHDELGPLLTAAGLSPDVLTPLDAPARSAKDDDSRDSLV